MRGRVLSSIQNREEFAEILGNNSLYSDRPEIRKQVSGLHFFL